MRALTAICLGAAAAVSMTAYMHQQPGSTTELPPNFPTGLNIPIPGGQIIVGMPSDTAGPPATIPRITAPPIDFKMPRLPHITPSHGG